MKALISRIHQFQDGDRVKKLAGYLFCMAVFLEVLIVLVDKSQYINPIEGRLFQVTFILFFIKVLLTKYEIREYIIIFVFCLLGLLVDFFGDRNEILRIFMFVAACKDIDIKKSLKYVLWISIAGCMLLALLSATGIFGDLVVPKEYPGNIFVNRYCFGMGNANAFHIMFFALAVLALYVYAETLKWYVYVILFVINIGIYLLTSCKTGLLMCAVSIIGMALIRFIKGQKVKRMLGVMCLIVQPLMVAISVFFAYASQHLFDYYWGENKASEYIPVELMQKVDNLLTGRISSLCNYTDRGGTIATWTLFTNSSSQAYFDLGFVRLFYWYGIIPAAIIIIVFCSLSYFLYKENFVSELAFITGICIFTVVEAHFVSVYIGRIYPLFVLGGYWSEMIQKRKDV